MFVGHLALALAAKRAAPRVSLGWLMAGVTALDLVWPIFLLLGVEQVSVRPGATAFNPLVFDAYPWSHSLVMAFAWGGLLVLLGRAFRIPAPPLLLVALVVSHWVLDFATHTADLPLWPGTSPRSFWSLVVVSTVMWASGPWSPPPPSPQALAQFALIGWIVLPWAAVADR